MQAMILAAGYGKRLRPITATKPKPLVQVAGQPLIDYHLHRLAALGITEVWINIGYKGDMIRDYCADGQRYGVNIHYSVESEPLGVVAGVRQAISLGLQGQFCLLSADIWTDFSFPTAFMATKTLAAVCLVDNPAYHPQGDFSLTADGSLRSAPTTHTYAGIARLDTALFTLAPQAENLTELLQVAIAKDSASAIVHSGHWFNVGTQAELAALQSHMLTP